MKDWHESQESWARLVAELRAENASLHLHQCRDLESGRERDALVERLQRTIGESVGEVDRLRAELADLRCDDSCSRTVEELQTRAWDAEAAITRVRELCANPADIVRRYRGWTHVGIAEILTLVERALEPNGGASG